MELSVLLLRKILSMALMMLMGFAVVKIGEKRADRRSLFADSVHHLPLYDPFSVSARVEQ